MPPGQLFETEEAALEYCTPSREFEQRVGYYPSVLNVSCAAYPLRHF